MSVPFLAIRNITKRFDGVAAVDGISLDIAKGEFMTFLGPSGSGKSTTLYMIAGFFDPTGGDVEVAGKSLLGVPSNKRNIGMVFQRYTLFPHLSVTENVAFPLRVRRLANSAIKAKVSRTLELVRLERFGDRMPAQLSGGQQQRVALARALAYDPHILLMDEPLSALDKTLREELQIEIKRIHRETGATILYVTHDQEEALRLSDRVALFNHGRIEQVGAGRDLYDNPATRFVAGFIGSSNFLSGTVLRQEGGQAQISLPDGTRLDGVAMHGSAAAGGKISVMIRPDRIRLRKLDHDGHFKGVSGTVADITFLGDAIDYAVTTRWGAEIAIRNPLDIADESVSRGDDVTLTWETKSAVAFPAS